jgi:hypothetical protein
VKNQVTYPKEMKQLAKDQGLGLMTFSVTRPDGSKVEYQGPANAEVCRFAAWIGGAIARSGTGGVDLTELETFLRRTIK